MPFTAPFLEVGEIELFENLMTVVHGNMKPALDYFYLADNLPDFALMTDGPVSQFQFPLLVLSTERMVSEETDDGAYLSQTLTIGAALAVKDTDLKSARIKVRKYVRAFKAVVRAAAQQNALLPPTQNILDHTIDIEHRYVKHGTQGTEVIQPVEIEIRIKFGEN